MNFFRGACFPLFFLLLLPGAWAGEPPEWFLPLRDAVYDQGLKAGEIVPLYVDTMEKARETLSGPALLIVLSRCEYMMGRAYQYEKRHEEAAERYAQGIIHAERALEEEKSAEGWQMLAENISQSCAVRPVSYALSNGLKVEAYAKKALELEPRNAAALYMLAARYVYAPAPFHNYRRGIQMMEEILNVNVNVNAHDGGMQRDDRFNVYSAIGYAFCQQKKYALARPWLLKSLEVYPGNKYVRTLLNGET
jgi:tetratricopeptide (TPR) repeat protein